MATEAAGSQDNALMSSSNNPASQQPNAGNPSPGEGPPSSNNTNKPPPQPIAPAVPAGSAKTEKPRPHVCGTCQRSFARLEHLKRHERSHTKEKPFECPECNRCFARRDLLLRHQQKLHMAGPSGVGRPRGGAGSRRESTGSATSTATGRVRKNSMPGSSTTSTAACAPTSASAATAAAVAAAVAAANTAATAPVSTGDGGAATMRARPRANTIAHIDSSTLGMIANSGSMGLNQGGRGGSNRGNGGRGVVVVGGRGLDVSGTGIGGQGFGSGTANRQDDSNLPRIDTSISSLDLGGMMPRSAGMFSSSSNYEDLEGFFLGNTINPTMLHFNMSPLPPSSLTSPPSPFGQSRSGVDSTYYSVDDGDDDLEWMSLIGNMVGDPVDQSSSPSAFSTASGGAASEVVPFAESLWQTGNQMPFTDFRTPNFTDTPPPDPLSVEPSAVQLFSPRNSPPTNERFAIPTLGGGGGSGVDGGSGGDGGGNGASNGDAGGNARVRTLSPPAESVTDATRAALATTLVRGSAFGAGIGASHHPLHSPFQHPHSHHVHNAHRPQHNQHNQHQHHQRRHSVAITGGQTLNTGLPKHGINLPLTRDLQRYVDAYIRFFHPHLPFLHIPTLRFDPMFRSNGGDQLYSSHGREFLVLSMAAIGALYEFEQQAAGELFEAAKKTVEIFLDERRKAAISAASNPGLPGTDTPLWLIQAMLLNSIFGLECGDRSIGEAVYSDVSTLVQLARAAGLTRPTAVPAPNSYNNQDDADIQMSDLELSPSVNSSLGSDGWCGLGIKVEADEGAEWSNWVMAEERKRTLYAVHFLSSLLVAAHNQDPKLVNNEVRLDLPCSEDLWNAPTANVWNAKGGSPAALQSSPNFAAALNGLLSAGQQQYGMLHSQFQNFNHNHSQHGGIHSYPPGGHVPSTFGCLVLICALHAYIWETRQNNPGRHWTSPEAEVMHAHIEPGLKAWQSAWYMTPHHSIERPNPFNMGTLSADCIPLLDLAYIRLFVDLGRAKEYFWGRNFDAMADELARGSEGGQSTPISSASSFSARSGSPISNAISPASSPGSTSTSPGLYPIKIGAGGSVNTAAVPRYAEPVSFHMVPSQTLNYIHPAALCEPSSHRERHLRRAAFYAADSLAMSDTLGTSKSTSYAADQDLLCRELPIQSTLCLFDCAQILAEWIATVQVRVAPYMGLITLENCELDCLEAIMNLESEDRKLLGKVRDMLQAAESKVSMELPRADHPFVPNSGLGPTVLRVSAYLLEQAVVWPATRVMAQALGAQAEHMDIRIRSNLPLPNSTTR